MLLRNGTLLLRDQRYRGQRQRRNATSDIGHRSTPRAPCRRIDPASPTADRLLRRCTQRLLASGGRSRQSRALRSAQNSLGTNMKVGFVGLGRMGQGMARRLLDAGHELWVFDQFAAQAAPLTAAGAHAATYGRRARGTQRHRRHDARRGRRREPSRARSARALRIACRKARSISSWARTASRSCGSSRRAIAKQVKRSSRHPCSAAPISPPAANSASSSAGPERPLRAATSCCNRWAGASSLRASNPSRPRPSSSRTMPCSAARWSRWPKASRSCASTTSSRKCFRTS